MRFVRPLLTTSLIAGLCAGALAQSSYDTTAAYTGWTVGTMGSYRPAFGQTFNTPSGGYNTMDDFSFWIASEPPGDQQTASDTFQADIYQWNGSNPVGPALYEQNLGTITASEYSFTQVTAHPNVNLTPGGTYVALLTDVSQNSVFYFPYLPNHVAGDGGGQMVYMDSPNYWLTDPGDMYWHADFSGTPEPFTIAGLGMGCLTLLRRRKKA